LLLKVKAIGEKILYPHIVDSHCYPKQEEKKNTDPLASIYKIYISRDQHSMSKQGNPH